MAAGNPASLDHLFEKRRGAVDVDGRRALEVLERRAGQPQRQPEELIVERAFFLQALDNAGSHLIQRPAAELRIQVVRCLDQFRAVHGFADINGLLRDLVPAGDHHDEDAAAAERHELDPLEQCLRVRGPDGKPDAVAGFRQHVRG